MRLLYSVMNQTLSTTPYFDHTITVGWRSVASTL